MTIAFAVSSIGPAGVPLDPEARFGLLMPHRRRGDPFGPSFRVDANEQTGPKESQALRVKVDSVETGSTPENLAAWLQAVAQRQDRDAFARLHTYFAPRLAAWLTRSGMTPAQAEDVVQETMVSVWRKAGLYSPALGGASTWIFVIARNLRTDYQRRKANRELSPLEDWDKIDDSPTAEDLLLTAERETKLRRALSQLSREQAMVLEQAYFAEKPQSAIARDLGVPLGTVKSRVRLALARLKTLMEEAP
ncbi:sigma-70 family RNA polymerase sigma factor [uncultured Rhodoblastus sp.]|uniref:sigma-70 family RNA polymerase sigma factor n=1 Tax=uncultured Rhodoblastus sp. TaxID=543037 RepID=UPI0025D9DADC|nr:sigma-70 family RNA polymerase sigma factor [uncultured Rhodoblastus sp.]